MDCELYLLTPPLRQAEGFLPLLRQALTSGSVSAVLLRPDAAASAADVRALVKALQPIAHAADVAFIVHDNADAVRALNSDGVHVDAASEESVIAARRVVGDEAQVGASCSLSRDAAMRAGEAGADYIAVDTTLMPGEEDESASDLIRWWSQMMELPVVAMAGAGSFEEACHPYVVAGADFLAVSTQVWDDPRGPEHALRDLAAAIAAV